MLIIKNIYIKDKIMTVIFYFQKVKGRLYCVIIIFCKNTFLANIKTCYSGKEGVTVTIFHIWLDTELVAPQ